MDFRKKEEIYGDLFYPFQLGWWLDLYTRVHENYYKWDDVRARIGDDSEYYDHALKQRNRYRELCDFIEERILRKHEFILEYLIESFNLEINFETNEVKINE